MNDLDKIKKYLPSHNELIKLFNYIDGNLYWNESRRGAKKDSKAGKIRSGYLSIMIDGIYYAGHRLIYKFIYGDFDESLFIDHIDRNPLNNKIENLRLADRYSNMHNREDKKKSILGIKGLDIHPQTGKIRARVKSRGVRISKTFDSMEDAKVWIKNTRDLMQGEFSRE